VVAAYRQKDSGTFTKIDIKLQTRRKKGHWENKKKM
jgi:hypothetical protein